LSKKAQIGCKAYFGRRVAHPALGREGREFNSHQQLKTTRPVQMARQVLKASSTNVINAPIGKTLHPVLKRNKN
jgi:hypothetical protein